MFEKSLNNPVISGFSMVVTVKENKVYLHGDIWYGEGRWIIEDMRSAIEEHDSIELHLHTPGGSVFDGNLVYTFLAKHYNKIHVIIDGLAASMGSILMLVGHKISIAENAYIMIHAPSGTIYGNAQDHIKGARLLESMQKNFLKKYSAKTTKSVEDLNHWMVGDNWFSAEEALSEGLVDEVIDPIMDDSDELEAYKKMDIAALINSFRMSAGTDRDHNGKRPIPPPTPENKSKTEIMKKLVISALALEGVTEASSETAVLQAITAHISALETNAKNEKDKADKLQAQLDESTKSAIVNAVQAKIDAGALPEASKEKYVDLGVKMGIESLNEILKDMQSREPITRQINNSSTGSANTAGKDWDALSKEGKLEALLETNLPEFKALYKAKYGEEYQG